jgi:hypothetical protein
VTDAPATVDVHQHLLPSTFVELLRRRGRPPRIEGSELVLDDGRFPFDPSAHDVEARVGVLDQYRIDVAVVSLQPTFGIAALESSERNELVEAWEAGIGEVVRDTGGRFAALAAGSTRQGFAGTCVGSEDLRDLETLEPVVDALQREGGFLFVHPSGGVPAPPGAPPWWAAVTVYTAQMQEGYLRWLAAGQERWPDLPVVFAILAGGAPFQLERLSSRGVGVRTVLHTNVFFDTASYGRRAIELCVETFGVEQIVFGTDLPVVDAQPTVTALSRFGESVQKLVRCDNPRRLLA